MLYIFWIQVLYETFILQLFSPSLWHEKAVTFWQIRIFSFRIPGNANQYTVSVDVSKAAASLRRREENKYAAPEFNLKRSCSLFSAPSLDFLAFYWFQLFSFLCHLLSVATAILDRNMYLEEPSVSFLLQMNISATIFHGEPQIVKTQQNHSHGNCSWLLPIQPLDDILLSLTSRDKLVWHLQSLGGDKKEKVPSERKPCGIHCFIKTLTP